MIGRIKFWLLDRLVYDICDRSATMTVNADELKVSPSEAFHIANDVLVLAKKVWGVK